MKKIINIRGCNGSGKTTLLRMFAQEPSRNARVIEMPVGSHRPIPITLLNDGSIAIIGDYTDASNAATTSGCDRIKTQVAAKEVIDHVLLLPLVKTVLFEGVIISTVYAPWKDWAETHGGMIWAFLDTPLAVCLSRIAARNGNQPINEQLVANKARSVASCKAKANLDGLFVVTINYRYTLSDLQSII